MKKKTVIGLILLAFCLVCRFVPAVAVKTLPKGALVEIECIAAK